MTTTLTVRLPAALARELKAKAKSARTTPAAVLRRAAADYVRKNKSGPKLNAMQKHLIPGPGHGTEIFPEKNYCGERAAIIRLESAE